MFKSKNFCHIASNNRNQVKVGVFVYRTTDDLTTVTTSGYFNERIIDINLHDIIIHEQIDPADNTQVAVNTLCVTGRSLDNVTTDVVSTGGGSGVSSLNGQTGDLNIKSINGNSLMGSGNLELSTYLTYPNTWTTTGTTKAFCDAIAADSSAVVGKAYLGPVTFSDLPASMVNAEVVVEIMAGTTAANKVIKLTCTSGNTAPYMWIYTYWNNGSSVSGWIGLQDELISGTNIKTINNQSLLGSGNITIDGDYVPQLDTMPIAGATNVGEIVQYSGTTDANYTNGYFYESTASYSDPSATISQTTGSGLTDITIDVDTFIAEEQPESDETVVFTNDGSEPSMTPNSGEAGGISVTIVDVSKFLASYEAQWGMPAPDGADFAILAEGNGDDRPYRIAYECDIGGYTRGQNDIYNLSDWGVTVSGSSIPGTYERVILHSIVGIVELWHKNSNPSNVTLSDYGISYSGTPTLGDALTVVYTAPAIISYSWERKDVQPAPEVPDVGIDWKTSVDLPGNFQEGNWSISPVFKITGGLPDGIYEFYYQMKVSSWFSSSFNLFPATLTFRYLVKIDNTYGEIKGMIFPVIDGEWGGNNSKRLPQDKDYIYTLGYKDGSGNLYLWTDSGWWNTDLHGYANPCPDVSDCFRLSAIKNMTTGDTYIAEGSLYNNVQPGTIQMGCQLDINAIQSSPYVPSSMLSSSFNIADLPSTQTLVCNGINFENGQWTYSTELTVSLKCGSDRFNARFQAFVDEYIITIDEATGIFASTEFVKTAQRLYVKLNLPVAASGVIQAQYAMKDMTSTMGCSFFTEDITGQSTTQLIPLKVGVTPSVANYIGRILQYTGTTDANYTNGYFYKATGNVLSVPGSVTCAEVSAYYKTISMDVDGFINYMMTLGYSKGTIEEWLNNNGEFSYDVDANTLSWSWYGLFPDPSTALQFFTFSPAAASGEYIMWRTSNYVAAHTEVQNAAWTEVKTQPGAVSPTVMPTLLAANWSGNSQMITVQGVTASNNVIVSPAPASASDWASAGIICTAQSTNSLTFTCTQTPSNDITVNVAIL